MTRRRGGRLPWVVLGVMVVGVPTLFTIMAPEAATWSAGLHSLVLVVWIPTVAVAAWFARTRQERGDEVAERRRRPSSAALSAS